MVVFMGSLLLNCRRVGVIVASHCRYSGVRRRGDRRERVCEELVVVGAELMPMVGREEVGNAEATLSQVTEARVRPCEEGRKEMSGLSREWAGNGGGGAEKRGTSESEGLSILSEY